MLTCPWMIWGISLGSISCLTRGTQLTRALLHRRFVPNEVPADTKLHVFLPQEKEVGHALPSPDCKLILASEAKGVCDLTTPNQ
ncbi:hypothetical protein Y1Q_0014526 [Alligator mississippiensis]|uniref:Secreted protein n=1 Tax=Alligator mississippiensis TaxID=8496 RepID=A0A151PCY2_ALLMI|nr:hypothetical protein Y1Q_0014526 [Alligator mississippiensis]